MPTTEEQVSLQLWRCSDMALICRSLKNPMFARSRYDSSPFRDRRVHLCKSPWMLSQADPQVSTACFDCSATLEPSDSHSDSGIALRDSKANVADVRSSRRLRIASGASTILVTSSTSFRVPWSAGTTIPITPAAMLSGTAMIREGGCHW